MKFLISSTLKNWGSCFFLLFLEHRDILDFGLECLRTGFTSAGFTSKKMEKTETGCKFRRRKSCLRKKIGVRFRNFISGRRTFIFFGGRPDVNRFTLESEKDVNPEHESCR